MIKVEDIQKYGKEHLETVAASAATLQTGIQAIATAHGDYAKKSFEDTKSYVEKLSGVKSLDKVIELQTEFAKSAYETFVAESQKIAGLYTDLAKQTFKPLEGMVAKFDGAIGFRRGAVGKVRMIDVLFLERLQGNARLPQNLVLPRQQLGAKIVALAVVHERLFFGGSIIFQLFQGQPIFTCKADEKGSARARLI